MVVDEFWFVSFNGIDELLSKNSVKFENGTIDLYKYKKDKEEK
jgi:hypothetical protein